ncbi:MAG: hypothetical protein J0H49_28270 [Acidobacteria bacterium]|nr:hypothetical protein [Acidobacteriota bacterium]
MPDVFLKLPAADRREALAVAAADSGRPIHLLDKDALIDDVGAVSGGLRLVPGNNALTSLSVDYARMLDDGLLLGEAEPFENLLEQCRDLETRANSVK